MDRNKMRTASERKKIIIPFLLFFLILESYFSFYLFSRGSYFLYVVGIFMILMNYSLLSVFFLYTKERKEIKGEVLNRAYIVLRLFYFSIIMTVFFSVLLLRLNTGDLGLGAKAFVVFFGFFLSLLFVPHLLLLRPKFEF